MSMLFAATYPERTVALVLYGTVADFTARAPDYKVDEAAYLAQMEKAWGTVEFARDQIATWGAPGYESDERLVAWFASYMRKSASPGAAVALELMNRQINATHTLPSIHVPTLVIAKEGDLDFRVDQVSEMASKITGARLVVLPGSEHFPSMGPRTRSSTRWSASWSRSEMRRRSSTERWRRCCSPTSSGPPRRRRSSAIEAGRSWSKSTTGECVASSPGTAAWRSTRRATGSSPRSTAPPARSGARGRSSSGRSARHRRPGGSAHGRGPDDRREGGRDGRGDRRPRWRVGRSLGGARLPNGERSRRGQRARPRGGRRARAEGRPGPLAPLPGDGLSWGDPRDLVREDGRRRPHRLSGHRRCSGRPRARGMAHEPGQHLAMAPRGHALPEALHPWAPRPARSAQHRTVRWLRRDAQARSSTADGRDPGCDGSADSSERSCSGWRTGSH